MAILMLAPLSSVVAQDSETTLPDRQAELPTAPKAASDAYLTPRDLSTIPEGPFGDKVRLGYQLFVNSQRMRDRYVGNDLNCTNCHMQAGGRANAAPLWAAFMAYPAYRKKNDKVNNYAERLQGCFTYSMNGAAPDRAGPELVAMSAYSYWLAMGAMLDQAGMADTPVPEVSDAVLLTGGKAEDFPMPEALKAAWPVDQRGKLAGRGYPKLAEPPQAPSHARGEQVYQAHCALCHGVDGQGIKMAGVPTMPPLWGSNTFNWGAGMHRINTAAYFIYENMPLGSDTKLTPQQAWDVAAFINSQERPQDPRFNGKLDTTQEKYHQHQGLYGQKVGDTVLGQEAYPSATVKHP